MSLHPILFLRRLLGIDDLTGTKCKWCESVILTNPRHAPIPVCGHCFKDAYRNASPKASKGNLFERLQEEFRAEAMVWVARLGAEGENVDDVLADEQAALTEVQRQIGRAVQAGDHATVERLRPQLRERLTVSGSIKGPMDALKEARERELEQAKKRQALERAQPDGQP